MNQTTTKKTELINYLQLYLLKKFYMNNVFEGIIQRLKNNNRITEKQFNSIIKFIEREKRFKGKNRDQIFEYFNPLISHSNNKERLDYEPNTLCKFIQ